MLRIWLRCVPCLLVLACLACAQQAAPGFTFRANVGEVLVQTNVLDKKGHSITSLPATDFTIYEDGVRQTVQSFSREDAPVSVGIIVDNSGSMRPKRVQVDQAALNFVRASNPQDEVFIVKFNDEYRMVAPFTSSIPKLEQGLGEVDPESSTALRDAVINAVGYMNQHATRAKKVLLLITDGEDDASSHSLAQTLQLLQSQSAPLIYCIGLFDSGDSRHSRHDAEKVLIQFADDTGGVAYFPKNLQEVDAITKKVAQDIRQQYSLIYRSNQNTPGYRTIRLEVKDARLKDLTAHTRRGYLPGTN